MSSDPCVDLCATIGCCVVTDCAARGVADTAGKSRVVGVAMGILFGIATIAACVTLAHTTSTVYNRWTGQIQQLSNARYIPVVAVFGGLFTFVALASAANAHD